jgi:hypothetical protein
VLEHPGGWHQEKPLMRDTRSNGARPPVNRDPDRRPSFPAPAFWPLPDGHQLTVCGRCCAAIPASDRAQQGHRQFHEQLAGLEDSRTR